MPQKNSSTKDIFRLLLEGTSFNLIAKVIAVVFGFSASLLISREYGSDTIGTIATVTSFYSLAATISLLGIDTFVLKIIPQVNNTSGTESTKRYYRHLLKIIFLSCTTVAITLLSIVGLSTSTVAGVQIFLPYVLIFTSAFLSLNAATLRSLGDYRLFSLLDFLPSLLILVIVSISIGFNLGEGLFTNFYFLAIAIVCFISFALLNIQFERTNPQIKEKEKEKEKENIYSFMDILKVSSPMLGVTMSTMIIQHTDILLISYFFDQQTVGIYSIYVKLSSMVMFATISINAMFSPTVALLHKQEKYRELEAYAKKTTALLSASSVVIALALFASNEFILRLYGTEFLVDKSCFYVLLITPVIHSLFGSTGFFLNMTGGQSTFFFIMASAAILNVIGNLILIPNYGIHGAAASSLLAILAWNLFATFAIKKRHGYTLFFTGSKT